MFFHQQQKRQRTATYMPPQQMPPQQYMSPQQYMPYGQTGVPMMMMQAPIMQPVMPNDSDTTTPAGGISTQQICEYVAQREQAREQRDFGSADMLREQLKSLGVEVWDKEREWRAKDGRKGPVTNVPRQPQMPMMPHYQQPVMQQPAIQQAWTPAPVPAMPPAGSLSSLTVSDITALVLQREQARANRDFAAADQMRDSMRALGIDVWDKEREWRTKDGRSGPI